MSFQDVLNQPVAVKLMQQAIRRNRVPNGMLLWGPAGVGKYTAAMEMAKALNCESGEDSACNACLSCRKIAHGNHPDVTTILPAGKQRLIKVEVIESLIENTAYRPFEGRYRVFIMDEADRMNPPAQSHFLKTLEEPISNTIFLLISASPNMLFPPIRSRCQKLRFGSLPTDTIATLLMKHRHIDADKARQLAAVSQGQMSRALNFLDTNKYEIVLDIMKKLRNGVDPMLVSDEFKSLLAEKQKQLLEEAKDHSRASGGADPDDNSQQNKEAQEKAFDAYVKMIIRQDLMEYLYLFNTLCRDEMVYAVTGDIHHVFNREMVGHRAAANMDSHVKKLKAIEESWLYIERNLNKDRVFRDLFFILAA